MPPGRKPPLTPASEAKAPGFVEPMSALLVQRLPVGDDWLYEIKLDGYRVLALKHGDKVRLISRNNKDLSSEFTHLQKAVAGIKAHTAILDGEIVAVDAEGFPRFQDLQHRSRTPKSRIVYYAFDVLNLEGKSLTALTLEKRKAALRDVLDNSSVLFSESLLGPPDNLIDAAREMRLEGIIAKRRNSRYEPGMRTGAWQKLRLNLSQEFVVGGYWPGSPFDGLLVGYYEKREFMFAAQVRAGFAGAQKQDVFKRIRGLRIDKNPFANLPMGKHGGWNEGVSIEDMKKMIWVKPEVVVQIAFVEWTNYGLLRHSSFLGIRGDKDPTEVIREDAEKNPRRD
jgi:DNA ligase D-like protein (predicted ligase)